MFATETNEQRALAKQMERMVLNPAKDAVARILSETSKTGVDVLLEMSGNPTAFNRDLRRCVRVGALVAGNSTKMCR